MKFRQVLGATAGFMLLGGTIITAMAAPATPEEATNLTVVKEYLVALTARPFDTDKVVTYFAPTASERYDDAQPAVIGPDKLAAVFKNYMTGGKALKVDVQQTIVRGPIVVVSRTDTVLDPGKPDQSFPVVGVFKLKDGKIVEWTDYVATAR